MRETRPLVSKGPVGELGAGLIAEAGVTPTPGSQTTSDKVAARSSLPPAGATIDALTIDSTGLLDRASGFYHSDGKCYVQRAWNSPNNDCD